MIKYYRITINFEIFGEYIYINITVRHSIDSVKQLLFFLRQIFERYPSNRNSQK